jgi:hypothetical protein
MQCWYAKPAQIQRRSSLGRDRAVGDTRVPAHSSRGKACHRAWLFWRNPPPAPAAPSQGNKGLGQRQNYILDECVFRVFLAQILRHGERQLAVAADRRRQHRIGLILLALVQPGLPRNFTLCARCCWLTMLITGDCSRSICSAWFSVASKTGSPVWFTKSARIRESFAGLGATAAPLFWPTVKGARLDAR